MDEGRRPLADLACWIDYLKAIGVRELHAPALPQRPGRASVRPPGVGRPTSRRVAAARPAGARVAESESRRGPLLPVRENEMPFDAPPPGDPAQELERLRGEIGDCKRCKLHAERTNIVFGVGDPRARLMFIGEGPGADEDAQGEPFVGRAGKKLDQMIEAIGLRREQVYIANIVKCRPPRNRDPETEEIETCSPFLVEQIRAIRPRVIVTLGSPATKRLLGTRLGITRLRGNWHSYRGIAVMPTFHPAYLLRAYTQENRRRVYDDLKAARARLDETE